MDTKSDSRLPLPLRAIWLFDCSEIASALELRHNASRDFLVPMVLYHLYREFHLINPHENYKLSEPWGRYYTQYQNWIRPMMQPLGKCVVQYQLRFVDAWLTRNNGDAPYFDDLHIHIARYPFEQRGT